MTSSALETGPRTGAAPRRLAVYYGYPTLVNGASGDVERAAAEFARYDALVFGNGLQLPPRDPAAPLALEHARAKQLIDRLHRASPRPEIFGYVAIGDTERLSMAEVVRRIEAWSLMGADGVFLDEAGYDFGVTRQRQNDAVHAAHARGLSACLNAFRPADVFDAGPTPVNARGGGNPGGLAPALTARDAFLIESFAVLDGVPETARATGARVEAAINGRVRYGTRIFAVATAGSSSEVSFAHYGWWAAAVFGIDAYGWGMQDYSAVTSALPWVERPSVESELRRAAYQGHVMSVGTRWIRETSAGRIVLDTETRAGALERR